MKRLFLSLAATLAMIPLASAGSYTSATVGTGDGVIRFAPAYANPLDIINLSSTATVCINFGAAATITGTQCSAGEIALPPLWHRSWGTGDGMMPAGDVHAISSAAGTPVSVGSN